jgi:hypothetical protein
MQLTEHSPQNASALSDQEEQHDSAKHAVFKMISATTCLHCQLQQRSLRNLFDISSKDTEQEVPENMHNS